MCAVGVRGYLLELYSLLRYERRQVSRAIGQPDRTDSWVDAEPVPRWLVGITCCYFAQALMISTNRQQPRTSRWLDSLLLLLLLFLLLLTPASQ